MSLYPHNTLRDSKSIKFNLVFFWQHIEIRQTLNVHFCKTVFMQINMNVLQEEFKFL